MSSKAWKAEERHAAQMLGGTRYPANSGGLLDVESDAHVAQVKHVAQFSLRQLEDLALEMAAIGQERNKVGIVVVKRRAGKGRQTPRLIVLTEDAWRQLQDARDTVTGAKAGQSE